MQKKRSTISPSPELQDFTQPENLNQFLFRRNVLILLVHNNLIEKLCLKKCTRCLKDDKFALSKGTKDVKSSYESL